MEKVTMERKDGQSGHKNPGRQGSYQYTNEYIEVNLQSLLDHTITRLLTHFEKNLKDLTKKECESLELICKWGSYGMFLNALQSNLLLSSLVPIRLVCSNTKKVVWQNPRPSSERYCRPIRMFWDFHEKAKDVKAEIDYIEEKTKSIQSCLFNKNGVTARIKFTLMQTPVDSQVCNSVFDTSTIKCHICGATSQQLNEVNVKTVNNIEDLPFGFSTRHVSIRLCESVLHLAYKLPLKTSQVTSAADEEVVAKRKVTIHKSFRDKMDVTVDPPKSEFRNSFDSIKSGMFFSDPEMVSEITGVDCNFVHRLQIILQVLSSGCKVDVNKFGAYCLDTAKLYVSLYPWMPMTLTMHMILLHGEIVMEKALLPIGLAIEEAGDAFEDTEATLMEERNVEIINKLMCMSDPLISSLSSMKKLSSSFSKEALEMILDDLLDSDSDCEDSDDD